MSLGMVVDMRQVDADDQLNSSPMLTEAALTNIKPGKPKRTSVVTIASGIQVGQNTGGVSIAVSSMSNINIIFIYFVV